MPHTTQGPFVSSVGRYFKLVCRPGMTNLQPARFAMRFGQKFLARGDQKNVANHYQNKRDNDRRWSRVAATRDSPTIAFFRAGALLRRSVPVPGILAAPPARGDYG